MRRGTDLQQCWLRRRTNLPSSVATRDGLQQRSSCATSTTCARRARLQEELVARLCDALSNAEQPGEKKNFSKAVVLKMFDLPEMQNLLRQKRFRWVGHALRRKDGDLSKDEAGACTQVEHYSGLREC